VVANAVMIEPVSHPKFLLTGKLTRNFPFFGFGVQNGLQKTTFFQLLTSKFPKNHNRELNTTIRESCLASRER